jgi:hypothetical protein
MSRPKWLVAAAAAFLAVAGVLSTGRPTTGQPRPAQPTPAAPGRFQMQTTGAAPHSTVFVLDTHTGQVWYRQTHPEPKTWTDMGSPAGKDGKAEK